MPRIPSLTTCVVAAIALAASVCVHATTSQQMASAIEAPFPSPSALGPQVGFWARIYVEFDTKQGVIHDNRHLNVVYQALPVSHHHATRQRQIRVAKKRWRVVLERLAQGGSATSRDARSATALWTQVLGRAPNATDFRKASEQLRFQRGQRDRFEAGLVRAGRYEARIRSILRSRGLPQDLAFLPHVESSFNTYAYSKSGAAGMWQFMPGTARRFLRVDSIVDERLAPLKATHAAAQLLADNYRALGTWPLAITAYNHGAAGMRRARKRMGTSDIVAIINHYNGRAFGFASRNFYAQFLAARQVAHNYLHHFGPLELASVEDVKVVPLPFYLSSRDVVQYLGIEHDVLAKLNPSLRKAVLRSEKYIPKGFELRLPPNAATGSFDQLLASIPPARRFPSQRVSHVHHVRRGDTLGHIARRYGTSIADLISANRLASAHRIRVGQKLEVPTATRK